MNGAQTSNQSLESTAGRALYTFQVFDPRPWPEWCVRHCRFKPKYESHL